MRIGIDIRCLYGGKRSGIEEYVLNLLPEIFTLDKKNEFILFFNSLKKPKTNFSWIEKYPNVSIKILRLPNKLLNFMLWYFSWPKLDKILGGVDYFFMPNISFAAISQKTKLILTVHDLSFERYPEFFSTKRRIWHLFLNPKKLMKKAKKVISVSKSTQEDLENIYSIEKSKIKIIPSGISEKLQKIDRNNPKLIEVKERYKLPFNFILYLGTKEPRKNIPSLILAFEELKKEGAEKKKSEISRMKLVLAGNSGWLEKNMNKIIQKSQFKEDIICLDFIPEKDKVFLYNLATIFIFPSFFEGFGFPPLEAQKCGLPVVASANSSFFETIGESSILLDQDRPQEIKEAIEKIILNKKIREKMIKKGIENSQKFSWEKSAQKFVNLINKKNENWN